MKVTEACAHILTQLSDLLENLSTAEYIRPAKVLNNNTIGQHLRHTVEFFLCLKRGASDGVVNYDNRSHDKLIETDKFIAMAAVSGIKEFIIAIRGDRPLVLEATYGLTEGEPVRVESNLQREIVYNIEHAVHHMAIMKIAIREIAPQLILPEDFGIAASTLRYASAAKKMTQQF